MLTRALDKCFAPKTLAVLSILGSAVSVTAGFIDGQPFSTLSFAGLLTSLTAAAVLTGVVIADLKERLDALTRKEAP